MPKAKKKAAVTEAPEQDGIVVSNPSTVAPAPMVTVAMQYKDLSFQKRVELYAKERDSVLKELSETYGVGEVVQLTGYPRGIVPQVVPVDLLAQKSPVQGNE